MLRFLCYQISTFILNRYETVVQSKYFTGQANENKLMLLSMQLLEESN